MMPGVVASSYFSSASVDPYWANVVWRSTFDSNVNDQSPISRVVTAHGGAIISTAQSKFGGSSLYLNGTNSYLDTPYASSLNMGSEEWTIELWFYPLGSQSSTIIAIQDSSTNGYCQIRVTCETNNSMYILWGTSVNNWFTELTLGGIPNYIPNSWNHLLMRRINRAPVNYDIVESFLNGNLRFQHYLYQSSYITPGFSLVNYSLPSSLGKVNMSGNPSLFFNGYIDDLRITKGVARSDTTVPSIPYPLF